MYDCRGLFPLHMGKVLNDLMTTSCAMVYSWKKSFEKTKTDSFVCILHYKRIHLCKDGRNALVAQWRDSSLWRLQVCTQRPPKSCQLSRKGLVVVELATLRALGNSKKPSSIAIESSCQSCQDWEKYYYTPLQHTFCFQESVHIPSMSCSS